MRHQSLLLVVEAEHPGDSHHPGDTGAVEIHIEQSHPVPQMAQADGQVGGNTALADAAFAAHYNQLVPDVSESILNSLGIVSRCFMMGVIAGILCTSLT